jgi:hypothetical protein
MRASQILASLVSALLILSAFSKDFLLEEMSRTIIRGKIKIKL